MDTRISPAVIRRLPRYYRYLDELLQSDVERISSNELSNIMHVTASQIRQDLNNFGQQGYGYNVKFLHDEIGKILGLEEMHNVILIGTGNLGQAIANYVGYEKLAFRMIGLFDVDENKVGKRVGELVVMHMDALPDFIKSHDVDIAALTLPKENALSVANELVELGITAIWNFAHVDLELPENVVVENVHLSDYLMQLSYSITQHDA